MAFDVLGIMLAFLALVLGWKAGNVLDELLERAADDVRGNHRRYPPLWRPARWGEFLLLVFLTVGFLEATCTLWFWGVSPFTRSTFWGPFCLIWLGGALLLFVGARFWVSYEKRRVFRALMEPVAAE